MLQLSETKVTMDGSNIAKIPTEVFWVFCRELRYVFMEAVRRQLVVLADRSLESFGRFWATAGRMLSRTETVKVWLGLVAVVSMGCKETLIDALPRLRLQMIQTVTA